MLVHFSRYDHFFRQKAAAAKRGVEEEKPFFENGCSIFMLTRVLIKASGSLIAAELNKKVLCISFRGFKR